MGDKKWNRALRVDKSRRVSDMLIGGFFVFWDIVVCFRNYE